MYNGRKTLHFACVVVLESEILIRRAIRFEFPIFFGVLVGGNMMLDQFHRACKVADARAFSTLPLYRTLPLLTPQEP